MEIWLYILGGALGKDALTNIGASCYLLEIKLGKHKYFFMIDAGKEILENSGTSWRGPLEIGHLAEILDGYPITNLLITHAHADHAAFAAASEIQEHLQTGRPIICTRPTAAFLPHVWREQLKFSRNLREKNKTETLPYTEREVFLASRRLYDPITRPEIVKLVPDHIWVYPPQAGHMRGACGFIFRVKYGKQDTNIMFSGDSACHDQLTTQGAPLPPDEWLPDIIASYDCTNGGEDLAQGGCEKNFWIQELSRLMAIAKKCSADRRWLFTPAFSLERFPTVSSVIADMGLAVCAFSPSALNFWNVMESPEGFWTDRDKALRGENVPFFKHLRDILSEDPAVVVASSGMGHGPAAEFHKEFLPDENAVVATTGFSAEKTNNFYIKNAAHGERILLRVAGRDGIDKQIGIKVMAHREHFRLTAHSLRETAACRIEALLGHSQNPTVGLCHGSTPALKWFEGRLSGIKTFRQDKPADRAIQLL